MPVNRFAKPAASVVVPAYNSTHTIVRCLDALMAQEAEPPYEVIVVESSRDRTAQIVCGQFPEVRLVTSKERLFSGAARNRGAEEASGELLCFVDSDCIVEKEWLSKMWHAHSRYDCAAVAGAVLNGNPEMPVSVSSYLNEFSDFYPYGRTRYMHYLSSANISYKAAVFHKHGGFDLRHALYVDLIFNTILSQAGEKLLFVPDIKAEHMHRTTLEGYLRHEFGRGRAAAAARRKGLMIGSSWVKYPALAFLAAPGLLLRKAGVFPYRFLRAYPSEIGRLLRALPYFYLALLVWQYGFLREVSAGRRQPANREESVKCASG